MKNKKNILITAAIAGLIAGATVPQAFAGDHAAPPAAEGKKDACSGKEGCNGKDSCKGKDAKADDHGHEHGEDDHGHAH